MKEQFYYGHGKLLLTGEYFILDGAKSVALPTNLGQTLSVKYRRSNDPKLYWKSYDSTGKCWFEASYELWHFDCLDNTTEEAKVLKTILSQARKQNVHFLRESEDVIVETRLEFPLGWGLGSSSTLIYNIAQWAYVSPFELLQKSFGGSGYDIACAQSTGPITYEIQSRGPRWEACDFSPYFSSNIYFVYLNRKQNTRESITRYKDIFIDDKTRKSTIKKIDKISEKLLECIDLKEFEDLIFEHENLVSHALDLPRVKDLLFSDFWGSVKSLGAWGGDFVMVTSDRSLNETKSYFNKLGYNEFLTFDELIAQRNIKDNNLERKVIESAVSEIRTH
jgi:mevalonate kinase